VKKPFLIRIDDKVLDAVQHWADDDLRSLNAQVEWLLRRALQQSGRLKSVSRDAERSASPDLAGEAG